MIVAASRVMLVATFEPSVLFVHPWFIPDK